MSELDGFSMDGCACSWTPINPCGASKIQYVRESNRDCPMHGDEATSKLRDRIAAVREQIEIIRSCDDDS